MFVSEATRKIEFSIYSILSAFLQDESTFWDDFFEFLGVAQVMAGCEISDIPTKINSHKFAISKIGHKYFFLNH